MTQDRFDLNDVSRQMGFDLGSRDKKSDDDAAEPSTAPLDPSDDLGQESPIATVGIVDQIDDPQPVEQKPLWRMLLIGGFLACTVGIGVVFMLWDGGAQPQEAKTQKGASPAAAPSSNPEKDKEVADLKARLAMEDQKKKAQDIANASPSSSSSSSPSSTSNSSPTGNVGATTPTPAVTPTSPAVVTTPIPTPSRTYQPPTSVQPLPIVAQRPSTDANVQSETAKLLAARRSRDQESNQLAALKGSVQKEKENLANLQKQKASINLAATSKPPSSVRTQPIRQEPAKQATPTITKPTGLAKSKKPSVAVQPPVARSRSVTYGESPIARQSQQPSSIPVAQNPKPSIQPSTVARAKPNLQPVEVADKTSSWEQAAAMGSYGGTPPAPTASTSSTNPDRPLEVADQGGAMSPILRLPVGESVPAKLITPFYTLIKNNDSAQPTDQALASVVLEKPIEVGSGWHLPTGTVIEFGLQVADNGLVQAVSKRVIYGNTAIAIPEGAFALTNEDSQPLMAQVKEVNGDKLTGADIRGAIWGAAGEVGNVIVSSGNQSTVSTGLGTTISTTNNPAPNLLGAVLKGAFAPAAQQEVERNRALAQRLEKQSKIGFLNPGTKARVYVAKSVAFQVPMEGDDRMAFANPSSTRMASRENAESPRNVVEAVPPPAPPTKAETDALPPPVTTSRTELRSRRTGTPVSTPIPTQTGVASPVPIVDDKATPKIPRSMLSD
jgi:hypothetical protein